MLAQVPDSVVQVKEAYRVYTSSSVSGSLQAMWCCAVGCLVLINVSASVWCFAPCDDQMEAGNANERTTSLVSIASGRLRLRLGWRHSKFHALLTIYGLLFSLWLKALVWVRGDDTVHQAYPSGHPLLCVMVGGLDLACCKFLLGHVQLPRHTPFGQY